MLFILIEESVNSMTFVQVYVHHMNEKMDINLKHNIQSDLFRCHTMLK